MHVSIQPAILFKVFGFPITNSIITAWVVMAILVVLSLLITRNLKEVPGRLQNFGELALDKMIGFLGMLGNSRQSARKYFPLLGTIFIFFLFCAFFEMLPGVGSIGFAHMQHGSKVLVPLFKTPTSALNLTLAVAIVTVFASHVIGVATIGGWNHFSKFLDFSGPVAFFVGILEIISEFAKVISLSFRLFGNMFAGEVLLVIIGFLVPFIAPLPFMGIALFDGIVQAMIFAALGMSYIASMEKMPAH